MTNKFVKRVCQFAGIARVAKNQAVLTRVHPLTDSSVETDNHGKAAAHGLERGQIERVFKRGSDENVAGCVKLPDVLFRSRESYAVADSQALSPSEKRSRVFLAHDQGTHRNIEAEGKGLQQYRKPLCTPVVADQEKDSFARLEAPMLPSWIAERNELLRGKMPRINAIGNDNDIAAPEIAGDLRGRVAGNRSQGHTRAGVDLLLEPADCTVIQPLMEAPQTASLRETRKLGEPMKHRVNENYVGVGAVNPWRKYRVEM